MFSHPSAQLGRKGDWMTKVLYLTVCGFAAGVGPGGYGVENNGNVQDDFDSMEKETLVTKLKLVGFGSQLSFTAFGFNRIWVCQPAPAWAQQSGFCKLVRPSLFPAWP